MKNFRLCLTFVVALTLGFAVLASNNMMAAQPAKADKSATSAAPAQTSCKTCHADFSALLPSGHPPVKGSDLAACMACHQPGMPGTEKKNVFSARIHLGHLPPKGTVDCLVCHQWSAAKKFGLAGMKESWGKPSKEDMDVMKEIFTSWASSSYTDNLHAKASISCANCHGKGLPVLDATVENNKCLECHGPMEQLVKRSEPADFKDRNPHKSHLGDIACTVCHKGHQPSKVYCLECHPQFKMTMPGTGEIKK